MIFGKVVKESDYLDCYIRANPSGIRMKLKFCEFSPAYTVHFVEILLKVIDIEIVVYIKKKIHIFQYVMAQVHYEHIEMC